MNDAGTLPRRMLEIRELTTEAFAPMARLSHRCEPAARVPRPAMSLRFRSAKQSSYSATASRGCGSCTYRMSG